MAHIFDSIKLNPADFSKSVETFYGDNYTTITCNHTGRKMKYFLNDQKKMSDLNAFISDCSKAKKEGKSLITETFNASSIQAPDDIWIMLGDVQSYGVTKPPKPKVVKNPSKSLYKSKFEKVNGNVVYLKDSVKGTILPYLKNRQSGAGNYPYIPLTEGGRNLIEPYYAYVLKNENSFASNPDIVSKAKEKMGNSAYAAIKSGTYEYSSFDSENIFAGEIPLEVANSSILDAVRYSADSDTRSMYTVVKNGTPVFVYDKNKKIVTVSNRKLKSGFKFNALGSASKDFRYKLFPLINYSENLYYPLSKTLKTDEGYKIAVAGHSIYIIGDKMSKAESKLKLYNVIKGDVVRPVVIKKFNFVILQDTPEKTVFVSSKHAQPLLEDSSNMRGVIEGDDLYQSYYRAMHPPKRKFPMDGSNGIKPALKPHWGKKVSPFEGGDIEDFHGGDVNFSGFDNNMEIDFPYDNNTQVFFNADGSEKVIGFDTNVLIRGDFFDNSDKNLDLSFDAEQKSNAIGDFFKNLFGKKKDGELTEAEAKALANPDKYEFKPEEVHAMYLADQKTNPKKQKFKQWINSDSSKKFVDTLGQIGYILLTKGSQQQGGSYGQNQGDYYQGNQDYDQYKTDENKEKTIFGFNPVTFGFAAIGITVLIVGGVLFFNRNK